MGRPFERGEGDYESPRLKSAFARVVAWRWYIVALYACVLPPSAYYAAKVGQDNSIDRLLARSDPEYVATRAFEKTFGAGEFALLLAEADDPFDLAVVQRVDRIERARLHQALDHARIFDKVGQNGVVSFFQQPFKIHQGTFRVGGRGERGFQVRLDHSEGCSEQASDTMQGFVHKIYYTNSILAIFAASLLRCPNLMIRV